MMHQHKKILVFDKLWKRLRYKQSTELKYHSIPKSDLSSKKSSKYSKLIKLSNNSKANITYNLRYISYSIPLLCIMLLLGFSVISLNPTAHPQTFALKDAEVNPTENVTPAENDSLDAKGVVDEEAEELTNTENSENENTAMTPRLSESLVTMMISNREMAPTQVPTDGIAYREHEITVNAQEVSHYSLSISYANKEGALRLEQDQSATLKNAVGTTMAEMEENSWGFAWGDISSNNDSMVYYGMPQLGTHATTISTGLLEKANPINYNASFVKKLVFGAKFGKNALSGAYHTNAILSLAATPKFTVGYWQLYDGTEINSGILTMQSMTTNVCDQVPAPTPSTNPEDAKKVPMLVLIDVRGGGYVNDGAEHSYIVGKLADGNCWMLQNLKLTAEDLETATGSTVLTSANSDVSSDADLAGSTVTVPSVVTSGVTTPQIYSPGDNVEDRQKGYGAYYNWYAASVNSTRENDEALASICPHGWKLPIANKGAAVNGSFDKLVNTQSSWLSNSDGSGFSDVVMGLIDAPGYVLGNGFFPAAGIVSAELLRDVGSKGYYWSRTVTDDVRTHLMNFSKGSVSVRSGVYTSYRSSAISVRCINAAN